MPSGDNNGRKIYANAHDDCISIMNSTSSFNDADIVYLISPNGLVTLKKVYSFGRYKDGFYFEAGNYMLISI